MITFTRLKYLSFTHSAVYLTLIVLAVLNAPAKLYFGWAQIGRASCRERV